jgi:L-ascorbate metabolism protein UlaG (beta-lactamase superfamily)
MKVTKYPQSCLILEQDGKRILIDPGSFVSQKYKASDLGSVDGILITHEHQDHVDPELLKEIVGDSSIPVVANQSSAKLLGDIVTKIVNDEDELEVAGFKITARELDHCDMVDGTPGPQNTGYVVNGAFFHPGDGISIENLTVNSTAVPIAGPDISPKDVHQFIKQVGCKVVIPIHYDGFPADPEFFKNMFSRWFKLPVEFIPLASGESTEV